MSTQTSVNNSALKIDFDLFPPRHLGRGRALKSTGELGIVSWDGAHVYVNATIIFDLAVQPYLLDVAFDQLDRPQISYMLAGGECFIYFYNGLISDYQTLSLGSAIVDPILCSDYFLGGVDTVLAYLKAGKPTYRLQSDRFGVEYTLMEVKTVGIKAFGYGRNTNSVQIIVGRWR